MMINESDILRPGERIDDLQRGGTAGTAEPADGGAPPQGLRIIQDPARFCFGMDAVLLSAYVQMKKARRGLDLGTGNGIIPILLSDRTDCRHLTGLEIQPASADLAARSVALNSLEERISIVQGDIREADRIFAAASFDFITCNPPYRTVGSGKVSGRDHASSGKKVPGADHASSGKKVPGADHASGGKKAPGTDGAEPTCSSAEATGLDRRSASKSEKTTSPECRSASKSVKTTSPDHDFGAENKEDPLNGLDPRAIARHELLCTFDDVARAAAKLLRPGGHFYLVHRPMRLPELITTLCGRGLEPKRMRFVYPHADQAPNMVLIDCVRGGGPELRVEPPLIVYEKDGSYTPELLQIYYG